MKFSSFLRGSLAAAGLLTFGSAAMAADLPSRKAAAPAPVLIDTFQPFQIRLKATAIIPDGQTRVTDSYGWILPAVGSSGGPGGDIFGAGAKVSTSVIPELDLAYYFTRNIAVELICCVSKHNVNGTGALAGLNIGSTWVFPPTVLLQYHFTNFGAFQPYVGVGVNFTAYFGQKAGNNYAAFWTPALGPTGFNAVSNLNIQNSWGVAGQVGFDYMLNDNWGINLDLKRIMMEPTATGVVYNTAVAALAPSKALIPWRAKVNIDPWVVSAGITYRFGGGASAPVVAKY
ncbi:MAG: OmpW family protein [Hyphomicrobiales bacterium]|nr:OmpW family protein [Hyphomicrobiales bacterium]